MSDTATPTSTRPGGRSARVRAAVHRAAEELLAEGGPDAATVPAVAARAGVHATTIYRRWGSAAGLLSAVAVGRLTGGGELVTPDTGSLHGDLAGWARDVVADLGDPDVVLMLRTVLGASGEPTGRSVCLTDRRTQVDAILDRERERGGRTPDPERLLDAILGPLYFRALFDDAPYPVAELDALVERVLAGA